MAKTEVTLGRWKAFWNATDRNYNPVKTDSTHCNWNDAQFAKIDSHPVRCVNVADAQAYTRWFAARYQNQLGFKVQSIGLPSELEWEYSARGVRLTQAYLWAENASKAEICRHAQTADFPGDVLPVDGRLPNGYGLHDMIGNVWEWTATPWNDQRSSMAANTQDPTGVSAPRAAVAARSTATAAVWRWPTAATTPPATATATLVFVWSPGSRRNGASPPVPLNPLPSHHAAAAARSSEFTRRGGARGRQPPNLRCTLQRFLNAFTPPD